MSTIYAGIDVSAKKVDVVIRCDGKNGMAKTFPQTPKGHASLCRTLCKLAPERVVMEATGMYYLDLAIALVEAGLPVSVINPKSYHHFAELKLKGTKTDPIDAALQAELGQIMQPDLWQPPRAEYLQLRSIGRHINRLVGNHAKAKNRLHALKSTKTTPRLLLKDEALEIRQLETRIERLRQAAIKLIQALPLRHAYRHFCGATGLADVSSLSILAELCVLSDDMKAKQVSRFAGLDVRQRQSGSSVRSAGRMSKAGNAYLRTALFYPAMSAIRYDANTRAFYDALVGRGKKKKQAIVAVMRKYLTGLWACYQANEPFDTSRLFDEKVHQIA